MFDGTLVILSLYTLNFLHPGRLVGYVTFYLVHLPHGPSDTDPPLGVAPI